MFEKTKEKGKTQDKYKPFGQDKKNDSGGNGAFGQDKKNNASKNSTKPFGVGNQ
ncbi:hypothetical protein [Helicobacter sp. 12S02634-8]|uniref:hypothetical protein n=1 Tax=Helicobacter sp. 12S02634-8 TaxID=1476199 RepID=UPI0015539CB6|nr:hypothetical protein [Helicobacter sp. 12S02634-8]